MSLKPQKLRQTSEPPTKESLVEAGVKYREEGNFAILEIPSEVHWAVIGGRSLATASDAELFGKAVMTMFGMNPSKHFTSLMIDGTVTDPLSRTNLIKQELKNLLKPTAGEGNIDVELLAKELGMETDMGTAALALMLEAAQLLDRKHKDYGPGNIGKFGLNGVTVRMSDKIERLANLMKKGDLMTASTEFESVEDTLKDIANYGIIGLLCLKGLWK